MASWGFSSPHSPQGIKRTALADITAGIARSDMRFDSTRSVVSLLRACCHEHAEQCAGRLGGFQERVSAGALAEEWWPAAALPDKNQLRRRTDTHPG
jgi:hypothetical protein